jgi:hypothetical protein
VKVSVWLAGALLAAVAGLLYRARLRAYRRGSSLSDDHIRSIETHGRVEVDEPLDLDEIRREERRFLEETAWDEPDED